jgi:hypothetical protein
MLHVGGSRQGRSAILLAWVLSLAWMVWLVVVTGRRRHQEGVA